MVVSSFAWIMASYIHRTSDLRELFNTPKLIRMHNIRYHLFITNFTVLFISLIQATTTIQRYTPKRNKHQDKRARDGSRSRIDLANLTWSHSVWSVTMCIHVHVGVDNAAFNEKL